LFIYLVIYFFSQLRVSKIFTPNFTHIEDNKCDRRGVRQRNILNKLKFAGHECTKQTSCI